MRMEAILGYGLTAAFILGAAAALSADVPLAGTKLLIKDKPSDATKRLVSFKAADAAVSVSGIDPTATGATVEIVNQNPGVAQSDVFALPAIGWTAAGAPATSYKYKDKTLANGPVKTAQVKGGKLVKLVAKGATMTFQLGLVPQGSVGVVFTSGSARYCTLFGGTVKKDTETQFKATKAAAPGTCPGGPTTTTNTMSTTASSSTSTSTATTTTSTSATTTTATTNTATTTTATTTTATTTTVTTTTATTTTATTTTTTTGSSTTTTTGPPICGNGTREGIEECDDGNGESTDACTNGCKNARCGDGIAWFGVEACDDGNASNADCCSTTCQLTPSVCGNGCISPGETCDDGNTANGDSCPSNCVINGCTNSGTQQQVTISLKRTTPPSPSSLTAFNLFLDYPDGQVSIPGSGGDANVASRVTFLLPPSGRSVQRNDLDYGINLGVLGTSNMLPNTNTTAVFHINFDLCTPATVPTPAQLPCTMVAATGASGTDYTAAQLLGLACTVTVP